MCDLRECDAPATHYAVTRAPGLSKGRPALYRTELCPLHLSMARSLGDADVTKIVETGALGAPLRIVE